MTSLARELGAEPTPALFERARARGGRAPSRGRSRERGSEAPTAASRARSRTGRRRSRERPPDWLKVRVRATPELEAGEAARWREQPPPHRLLLGGLPEPRRVLVARHRHLHDRRQPLHAALRLLRRHRPAGRTPLDPDEPARVAEAVAALGLRFAVVTCVARDDLADGGAGADGRHRARDPRALPGHRRRGADRRLRGRRGRAAQRCSTAGPDVLNHNLETVERLQRKVRPAASYERSLAVLRRAGELAPGLPTKSGLMLGLGERDGRGARALARPARGRRHAAHARPVPAALARSPAGRALGARPRSSRPGRSAARALGFARSRAARSCAAPTTRSSSPEGAPEQRRSRNIAAMPGQVIKARAS